MSKLLFIGGTGFLGQSFFDCLNKGKIKKPKLTKIYIISRRGNKIKSKVKNVNIKKSILNLKKIPLTDYIIYAANSSNNNENIKGVKKFINLLTKKHKKTKIIFTSSGAVYGPSKIKKKFKEKDSVTFYKVNKFNGYKKNYAKTKILIENEFKNLGLQGFNVSIARLFTFVGEKILKNKNFAISNLIDQAQNVNKKNIYLSSSNDVYRGYMNSEDLIKWIIKIMIKSSNKCEIYNVGSDEAISIKKLANFISKKYKKKISLVKNSYSKSNDYYVPSILKAKNKLNLKIKYKIKDSLKRLKII
jgi:nucleoside-diphosphate-sugar epimerase